MGMITIKAVGSFDELMGLNSSEQRTFSAMKNGHANAVAEAIKFLSEEVLPRAIANDHRCHSEKTFPENGFDKYKA